MKKLLLVVLLALIAASCATSEQYKDGRALVEAGNVEGGLAEIAESLKKDPNNAEMRTYYERHKLAAVEGFLAAGDRARGAGHLDTAEAAYQKALKLDPESNRAKEGIERVKQDQAAASKVAEAEAAMKAGRTDEAYAKAKAILAEYPSQKNAKAIVRKVDEKRLREASMSPKLNEKLKKPITMEFRDAPVRTVFELISKHTGLNFVFDRDMPADARATVYVRDTSIEDVMRYVLVTNQLEKKVLNENTVLIYPNSPQKQQAYKELVVKSFYLANADVKQTANMVRQLVKTRDLFVDEKLNLLVMRDTPEAVRMAEKLISNQDLAEAEVMLELEVLEVGYNKLQSLGIQWPGQVGVGIAGAAGTAGQITGTEAQHFNSGLVRITVPDPLVQLNARRSDGRTNVLANPRIRVKNKEKARIHIGDKVPVITTTAGATGFVSESVNYLDVGLKLEVEPQVFLDDDVGIKVGLEVSNVSNQIKTSAGTLAYQVGTRNANTVLRLRDGETQVLAGLINDEDRRNANRVPGFSDLPGIGRLFSSNDDTANKTEVVLLITPHVIRNVERPGVQLEEFNSGTEAEVGGAPMQLQSQVPSSPGNVPPARTAPAPSTASPVPPAANPAPVTPSPSQPYPPQRDDTFPPRPPAAGPKPAPAQTQ
ncbi:MAG TPA: secretin N-terminal domain-containing protein [Burkholderiales bacterium]